MSCSTKFCQENHQHLHLKSHFLPQSHLQNDVNFQDFPWHHLHRALLPLSTLSPHLYFRRPPSFHHRMWLLQNGSFFLQHLCYYLHDHQFLRHLPFSRHYLSVTLYLYCRLRVDSYSHRHQFVPVVDILFNLLQS